MLFSAWYIVQGFVTKEEVHREATSKSAMQGSSKVQAAGSVCYSHYSFRQVIQARNQASSLFVFFIIWHMH